MRRALAISLLLISASVHAEDVDQAKTYFLAGAAAFDKEDYLTAIQAFDKAQSLAPRPAIQFSLAQAHRKQFAFGGDVSHAVIAVKLYREYLKAMPQGGRSSEARAALEQLAPVADRSTVGPVAPVLQKEPARISVNSTGTPHTTVALDNGDPSPAPLIGPVTAGKHVVVISADGFYEERKELTAIEGTIVAIDTPLREKPALVTINTDSGARIDVDGRTVGTAPLSAPLAIPAGVHYIGLAKNGSSGYGREIELARGETRTIVAPLTVSTQRKIALTLLSMGGAGIVTGGVFLGLAFERQAAAQDILDKSKTQNITPGELASYESAQSARDTYATVSATAFAVGGALALTGVFLFAIDQPNVASTIREGGKKPTPQPLTIDPMAFTPMLGPNVVGGAFSGSF